MSKMQQIWGRARQRTDRVSMSIYGALVLLGTGVGLLVGNSAPDPLVISFALASFAAAVVLIGLAVVWSRIPGQAPLLGVVYPEESPKQEHS